MCRGQRLKPNSLPLLDRLMSRLREEKKGKIYEKSFKKDGWRVDGRLREQGRSQPSQSWAASSSRNVWEF